MKTITLTLIVSAIASTACASEKPLKVEKAKLEMDVNYLLSSSSATGSADKETQSLSGNVAYQRKEGMWGQAYRLEGVNSRSKSATGDNIERYLASAKGMRYLSGADHYFFAKLQAEKDRSTLYDYTLSPTVGYGRTLLSDKQQSLIAEIGVGGQYLKNKLTNDADFEALATVGGEYRRQVTDSVNFEQDFSFEFAESLRTLRARTAILAKLSDTLSGQVSYQIKDADGDTIDTKDTMTSVGLRYTY